MTNFGGGWRARIPGGILFSLRKKKGVLSLGKCIYMTSANFLFVNRTTSRPAKLGPHHVTQKKELPTNFGHHTCTDTDQGAWNPFEMRLEIGWKLGFRKSNDRSKPTALSSSPCFKIQMTSRLKTPKVYRTIFFSSHHRLLIS